MSQKISKCRTVQYLLSDYLRSGRKSGDRWGEDPEERVQLGCVRSCIGGLMVSCDVEGTWRWKPGVRCPAKAWSFHWSLAAMKAPPVQGLSSRTFQLDARENAGTGEEGRLE